jgi:aspartate oxidase
MIVFIYFILYFRQAHFCGIQAFIATFNDWDASRTSPSKEKVMVSHLWDEIRRIMWNFVGIVRSNKHLHCNASHGFLFLKLLIQL